MGKESLNILKRSIAQARRRVLIPSNKINLSKAWDSQTFRFTKKVSNSSEIKNGAKDESRAKT